VGLSHYTQDAMLEKLAAAGFSAERAPRNIGHNQWRMTFLCRVQAEVNRDFSPRPRL